MNATTINAMSYPAPKGCLGCGVSRSVATQVEAKDLAIRGLGWAFSGRRPTPHLTEAV